ncbi:MAG: hypothetical protein WD278_18635 [Pirellulales bacterium]
MKIVINEPSWTDPNGPTEVHFREIDALGLNLWEKPTKEIPYVNFLGMIPIADLPKTLYAEARVSSSLKDQMLSVEYAVQLHNGALGVKDTVLATGIWSEVIADYATKPGVDVFGTQADPKPFDDMEDPPSSGVYSSGLGEIPIGPEGVRYGIAFQFHILPGRDIPTQGSWESDGVMFDLARKLEYRRWDLDHNGVWTPEQPPVLSLNQNPNWPLLEEEANDFGAGDPPNNWESPRVTPVAYPPDPGPSNNMYSSDQPRHRLHGSGIARAHAPGPYRRCAGVDAV